MPYQRLIEISNDLIADISSYPFTRKNLLQHLEPAKQNVCILKGARGIGKSTVCLQFLLQKQTLGHSVLYLSADNSLITKPLAELAQDYYRRGGEYLVIDEIHKSNQWHAQVKTIIDSFPKLKLIISGSASMLLDHASADLSRRHIMLHAKGLSFREYLNKTQNLNLNLITLPAILEQATDLSLAITRVFRDKQLDLLSLFKNYLQTGYFLTYNNYPTENLYFDSLLNSINSIIDVDLSATHQDIDNLSKQKIKLLLKHIATLCPFTPNIAELSRNLSIANDNSLKKYLYYLNEGEVLTALYPANKSHKDFQKPQKILLNNTNYAYAFNSEPLIGTIRETFVANCLAQQGIITAPTDGDFCLNEKYIFEVGGKSKNHRQIKSIANSYVLADDILSVEHDKIPIWLLGFLW